MTIIRHSWSTREGRFFGKAPKWILQHLNKRADVDARLRDLPRRSDDVRSITRRGHADAPLQERGVQVLDRRKSRILRVRHR